MTKWDFLPRAFLAAILAIAAPICALAQQPQLKIFDAHLHYNDDTVTVYSVDEALDIFRRNGVAGILANSLPNDGTRLLVEAKAPGLWVVPFIRPYRVLDDMQRWFNDPSIYELIETEYRRGDYRGIGEFHPFAPPPPAARGKKPGDLRGDPPLFLPPP